MTHKHRRTFLASIAATLPLAVAAIKRPAQNNPAFKICPRGIGGPNAARFPKAIVQDQDKRKAWFYEELIDGKLVLISFTSVSAEKQYPVLDNLIEVHALLEKRLGKDVFMYTITTEPHLDGSEDLKRLAESRGAKWRFLTGEVQSVKEILTSFNVRGRLSGLTWIGNEKTGRWIKRPSRQSPLAMAEAVARLSVGRHHQPFLVDRHSAKPGISRPNERNQLKPLPQSQKG